MLKNLNFNLEKCRLLRVFRIERENLWKVMVAFERGVCVSQLEPFEDDDNEERKEGRGFS